MDEGLEQVHHSGERTDGHAAPHGVVRSRGAEAHAREMVTNRTGHGHTSRRAASSEGAVKKSWSGGGSGRQLKAESA